MDGSETRGGVTTVDRLYILYPITDGVMVRRVSNWKGRREIGFTCVRIDKNIGYLII